MSIETTSVRNGCGPDSKPASRGFDSFHRCFFRYSRIPVRTIDNWTSIRISPRSPTGQGGTSLRRRPCAGEDARVRPGQPSPGPQPRGRRPAVGQWQGRLIWVEEIGGSSPPSWTRRPQDACYRPSGRRQRALRRKSARHPAQGALRPWLNWREHRSTKPGSAGSNPAGRAVSEAEVGDAPGCGPGGSGFEPRRTP
jgi:hypothetical protein